MYSKATCQRVGPVGVTKRLVFVPRCKMTVRTVRGRHFTRGGGGGSSARAPWGCHLVQWSSPVRVEASVMLGHAERLKRPE